jgi:dipeptidyl aminopeptidase/acylaminoacyl peptidase
MLPRVLESEAEQLVSSPRERGIDHEYRRFPDAGHGVEGTGNRVEYITRTVEYFRSHV